MRSYHVAIAALAANSEPKWVDNLLSHFELPGVESARQGIARRISLVGIEHIALVRRLAEKLDVPLSRAVALAIALLAHPDGQIEAAPAVRLGLDHAAFKAELTTLLADAVETTAPARRGRKPARLRSE